MAESKTFLDKQRSDAEAAAKASQDEAERNTYLRGGENYNKGHRVAEYDAAHPEYGGQRPQAAYEKNPEYYSQKYASQKRNEVLYDQGWQRNEVTFRLQKVQSEEQVRAGYERQTEEAVQTRPGYYQLSDIGDLQTQRTLKTIEQANKGLTMVGLPTMNLEAAAGAILETQRQQAYKTPTVKDEQFYGTELTKWAQRPIEKASAYHDIGMKAGVSIPENPYELRADLAVEFLKGEPHKTSERFSPVSGKMTPYLPGGQGLQETIWDTAIAYERGTQTPAPVNYMDAINVLSTTRGGLFTGEIGRPAQQVDMVTKTRVVAGQAISRGGTLTEGAVLDAGQMGLPKPFLSTAASSNQEPKQIDYLGVLAGGARSGIQSLTFGIVDIGGVFPEQFAGGKTQYSSEYSTFKTQYAELDIKQKDLLANVPTGVYQKEGVYQIPEGNTAAEKWAADLKSVNEQEKSLWSGALKSGLVQQQGTEYTFNKDTVIQYGEYSKWQESVSNILMANTNVAESVRYAKGAESVLQQFQIANEAGAQKGDLYKAFLGSSTTPIVLPTVIGLSAYQEAIERPADVGVFLASGAVLGGVSRGIGIASEYVGITKVVESSKILTTASKAAPWIFTGVVGAAEAYKSTEGFTEFRTAKVASNIGKDVPALAAMGAGFAGAYYSPEIAAYGVGKIRNIPAGLSELRTGVSERYYQYQQSKMGIETLGVGKGKVSPYEDIVLTRPIPEYAPKAPAESFVSGYIGEGNKIFVSAKQVSIINIEGKTSIPGIYRSSPDIKKGSLLENIIQSDETSNLFPRVLAIRNNEIIGGARYFWSEMGEIYGSNRVMGIESIETINKGEGIGTLMVDQLVNIAKGRQAKEITGSATTDAIGFWKKMGAETTGEKNPFDESLTEISINPNNFNLRVIRSPEKTTSNVLDFEGADYYIPDTDRYASLEYLFDYGQPRLEATKTPDIIRSFQIRQYRESTAQYSPNTIALSQSTRFTGAIEKEFGLKLSYNAGKLQEPIGAPEAWTTSQRSKITAKVTELANINPFTGEFQSYVYKSYDLYPKPEKGFGLIYKPEEYGYTLNIYDLPMRVETIGKGYETSPQINAMTKAMFEETRSAGIVDVTAKRTIGEFGQVSRGFTEGTKRMTLERKSTSEIGKVFSDLTESETPVDIGFRKYTEGKPTRRIIQNAKARESEIFRKPAKVKTVDVSTKGISKIEQTAGQIEIEVPIMERFRSAGRDIIRDLTPPRIRGKEQTTEYSRGAAMATARAMRASTEAANIEKIGLTTREPFADYYPAMTREKTLSELINAKKFREATEARNKEFVGGQIADILAGKGGRWEPEIVRDTTLSRIYSEAMFIAARKQPQVVSITRDFGTARFEDLSPYEQFMAKGRDFVLPGRGKISEIYPGIIGVIARRDLTKKEVNAMFGGTFKDTETIADLVRGPSSDKISKQKSGRDEETQQNADIIPITDVVPIREIITQPQETTTTTKTILRQFTETPTMPVIEPPYVPTIIVPPSTSYPLIPVVGVGDISGAGNWGLPTRKTRKYTYQNPIVDLPYLIGLSGRAGKGKPMPQKKKGSTSILDDFGM